MSYILCIVNIEFMWNITIVHGIKDPKEQSKKQQQPQDTKPTLYCKVERFSGSVMEYKMKWGEVKCLTHFRIKLSK